MDTIEFVAATAEHVRTYIEEAWQEEFAEVGGDYPTGLAEFQSRVLQAATA